MVRYRTTWIRSVRTLSVPPIIPGTALGILLLVALCGPPAFAGCDRLQVGGPPAWTLKAPIPLARVGATGVMIGTNIYVTHGSGPPGPLNPTTFIYSRTTDTWAAGAPATVLRTDLTGVCVEDAAGQGLVFTVGGTDGVGPLNSVEIYNPVTNTWAAGPPMPTPRRGLGAAWVPGFGVAGGLLGTVYVFGGSTGNAAHTGAPLGINEAFDVDLGVWMPLAPMPIPMMDIYSTTYFPDTNLIYVFGGFDGVNVSPIVQIYDPVADIWAPGAPMPTSRSNLISGICGANIYAIGGRTTVADLTVNEAYDPFTDTWAPSVAKPTPSSAMASQFIYTGLEIYAIGGRSGLALSTQNQVFTCGAVPLCFSDFDCDDGNPCTADSCNPATFACVHAQVGPGPVGNTLMVTHASGVTKLNWSGILLATHYNTYRGTIPPNMLNSRVPVYDHTCFESDDVAGDGLTTSTDTGVPGAGNSFYYDVDGENASCEGPLGSASNGTPRPNLFPCPTPP